MTTMIPPTVHESTHSKGEYEIFRKLQSDPGADDWIVLHSLDISHHSKNIAGEVDFLVIIPQKGILCLEVKGCGSIARKQGQWYYGSDKSSDSRGPFKQAAQAMHSIRKYLCRIDQSLSSVVFWSAVLFPYVDFSIRSDEWHDWQAIDNTALRSAPLSALILPIIEKARLFLEGKASASWFNPLSDEPTILQCLNIAEILRPNFEFYESPASRSEQIQTELKYYTSEQYEVLDSMQDNNRVAFIGPAGTGKTLLAIESARRGIYAGRKVLLICFNRLLGNWLQEQTADLGPNLVTGTMHKIMLSAVEPYEFEGEKGPQFWQSELPLMAIEKVIQNLSDVPRFDEIIVDEAQDILQNSYLDYLSLVLKEGLTSGRILLFGDFEKQAIYHQNELTPREILIKRFGDIPSFSLRCNCRNTPRVVELVHLLARLIPHYRQVLRSDDGIEPVFRYYSSECEQSQLLVDTLEELVASGYSYKDIVILSTRADKHCLASRIEDTPWKSRLSRYSFGHDVDKVLFTSIYAFKGMEAPVIIVTDLEKVIETQSSDLFYVAITRALSRLIILAHSGMKKEILKLLVDR